MNNDGLIMQKKYKLKFYIRSSNTILPETDPTRVSDQVKIIILVVGSVLIVLGSV